MSDFLLIPGELRVGGYKRDKSIVISINTLEISPEELHRWNQHDGEFGWMGWSPNTIQASQFPEEPAKGEFKTQSQRLRGALMVYHKKMNLEEKENISANDFYHQTLEKYISEWIEKLREHE